MIVYAVFKVSNFHAADVEIKTLIALRSTQRGADEVVSHQSTLFDYEVEEWEVLE